MPREFQILNNFGVPNLGLIIATLIPALMVVAIPDVAGLGDLYAGGVVGAIATNLGATSTDPKTRPFTLGTPPNVLHLHHYACNRDG